MLTYQRTLISDGIIALVHSQYTTGGLIHLICKSCGTENEESAKFCTNCGRLLDNQEITAHEQTSATASKGDIAINTELFSNYWLYVKSGLKAPSQHSDDFGNGLITLVLLSAFAPLSLVIIGNRLFQALSFGFMSSAPSIGFSVFIKGLLITAAYLALYALLIFLFLKIAKFPATFKSIIARLGHLCIPLMLVSAVMIILPFILESSYLYLFALLLIGLQIAFFITLYSFCKPSGFDAFYLITACQVVFNIILFVVLKQYLITTVQHIFSSINPF